ncbi:MAG: GGDEF domain-containing protein [Mycobacterium sp.]
MRLRSGPVPDRYNAFTARLAAAGYQPTTMRVVGCCILALGLSALLAGVEPRTTPWPGFRLAYIGIALGCVVLAVPWFRYRWPTRRESIAVVVVGNFALAAGCLATIDPMAGMLTAAAFPFVLGFCALFHSSRLLTMVSVVTSLTVIMLFGRIARHEIATAVAVTIPIVLLCVVTTYACRTVATVAVPDGNPAEVDPVTGLLTREAFYEQAATLMGARNRGDDRYLVIASITIDTLNAITGMHGARAANRATVAAAQALRETVRRGAVTGHFSETEFLVADTFTTPDPAPLGERLRGAVASTPSGITASIGVVSTALGPLTERPPYDVLDEVIARATEAMAQARRDGGNRVHYVFDTDLRL